MDIIPRAANRPTAHYKSMVYLNEDPKEEQAFHYGYRDCHKEEPEALVKVVHTGINVFVASYNDATKTYLMTLA